MRTLGIITFTLLTLCLTACTDETLQQLKQEGELVVLTRNAPTTYYEGRDGPTGPEYDLVTRFATDHKLNVRFKILDSVDDILKALSAGEGHLAAAGLTRTDGRLDNGYAFGPAYLAVQQQVVCRRDNGRIPNDPSDLVGLKLRVIDNSSYQETLKTLQQDLPALRWQTDSKSDTEQLLEQVWRKKIDCTLADSFIVDINRRYHPELVVAFNIGQADDMAWMLSPKWIGLDNALEDWLDDIEDNGFLDSWHERYFGHVDFFDYVDIRALHRRIKQRLPKYKKTFMRAAKKYKLRWTLLAAQGYQESHWRQNAKSPTGVRGIMMLTLNTANSVNVKNRLDPVQSIYGGARYLRRMIKRIPDTVHEDDRVWFALAAYNVGFGHLNDARILAERLGKNPDRWVDLKDVLPLLSQKKYYKTLKYGYARGTEPVRYVQRIRNYRQILEKNIKPK